MSHRQKIAAAVPPPEGVRGEGRAAPRRGAAREREHGVCYPRAPRGTRKECATRALDARGKVPKSLSRPGQPHRSRL